MSIHTDFLHPFVLRLRSRVLAFQQDLHRSLVANKVRIEVTCVMSRAIDGSGRARHPASSGYNARCSKVRDPIAVLDGKAANAAEELLLLASLPLPSSVPDR